MLIETEFSVFIIATMDVNSDDAYHDFAYFFVFSETRLCPVLLTATVGDSKR